MLKLFTRGLATATKNDKIMKKILKYQYKIKNLIIENNLQLTGYTYSYSYHDKSFNDRNVNDRNYHDRNVNDRNFHDRNVNDRTFNEKEYIKEEKEYIIKMNKFYNL